MDKVKQNYIKHISEMCLKYPTYHAGSEGERERANYIEKVFHSYGIKTRREEYPIRCWDFKSFSLVNVTKGKEVPTAICCHFSGSVDAEQKIMMLTPDMVKNIDNIDVKDQIVFVCEVIGHVFDNNDLAVKLEKMGAKAAIYYDRGTELGLPSSKIVRPDKTEKIGLCSVGPFGAMYIAANKNDTYRLKIDAKPYDGFTDNVIGYIEGGDKKAVFGAHYDSAPCLQGAGDDVSGTAMLLEVARLMKDKTNGFTLEFGAFSTEEYISIRGTTPPGSQDYVNRHKHENIAWFMNFDDYAGPEPYYADYLGVGHLDKLPEINWPMPPVRAQLAGDDVTFFGEGIPTIWLGDKKRHMPVHTVADCIDIIDFDRMTEGTKKMISMATQLLEKMK